MTALADSKPTTELDVEHLKVLKRYKIALFLMMIFSFALAVMLGAHYAKASVIAKAKSNTNSNIAIAISNPQSGSPSTSKESASQETAPDQFPILAIEGEDGSILVLPLTIAIKENDSVLVSIINMVRPAGDNIESIALTVLVKKVTADTNLGITRIQISPPLGKASYVLGSVKRQ